MPTAGLSARGAASCPSHGAPHRLHAGSPRSDAAAVANVIAGKLPAGRIRIGIAGWRYPPWRGSFYPDKLPQKRELEYASRALPTIELNGSFYSLQRPQSYAQWYDQTPEDFVFSVKAPRYITQILRLRGAETPVANFFASGIANLRHKLGPILWQLPPNMTFDAAVLEPLLALLPHDAREAEALALRHDAKVEGRSLTSFASTNAPRHALEVRNASFAHPDVIALLRAHRVALVIADSAGKWPEYEDLTADFVYLRLHGADTSVDAGGYSESALDRFAARIVAWSRGSEPADARRIVAESAPQHAPRAVYCYFDHTAKVEAPRNALRLAEKVRMLEPGRDPGGSR